MIRIPTITDLVQSGYLPDDELLLSFVREAAARKDSVFAATDVINRGYAFLSDSCEHVLGYSVEEFLKGGAPFVFSLMLPEYIPIILETQERNLRKIKSPDFDPSTVFIHKYTAAIKVPKGTSRVIVNLAVALTYTPHMDIQTGLAIMCIDSNQAVSENTKLLTKITERYQEVMKPVKVEVKNETLLKLINYKLANPLSNREEEVLKAIAKGYTTLEIARSLHIEENTVESHRKNILKKFEAKNVAELIKKASKIYWLE